MGVDFSFGMGWGFKVDPAKLLTQWLADHPQYTEDEYDGDWEALESLKLGPLLSFDTGGSHYTSDGVTHVIGVERLSKNYGSYNIPGGVIMDEDKPKSTLTLVETVALDYWYTRIGTGKVGNYVTALWH